MLLYHSRHTIWRRQWGACQIHYVPTERHNTPLELGCCCFPLPGKERGGFPFYPTAATVEQRTRRTNLLTQPLCMRSAKKDLVMEALKRKPDPHGPSLGNPVMTEYLACPRLSTKIIASLSCPPSLNLYDRQNRVFHFTAFGG